MFISISKISLLWDLKKLVNPRCSSTSVQDTMSRIHETRRVLLLSTNIVKSTFFGTIENVNVIIIWLTRQTTHRTKYVSRILTNYSYIVKKRFKTFPRVLFV